MSTNQTFDPIPFDDSESPDLSVPVPANEYDVFVTKAFGAYSKKGNPQVRWQLKIDGGEYNGRIIFHDTPTTGRGAGLTRAVVKGLGVDFDDWFERQGRQITPDGLNELIGERALVDVRIDEPTEELLAQYPDAKPRNKIVKFIS